MHLQYSVTCGSANTRRNIKFCAANALLRRLSVSSSGLRRRRHVQPLTDSPSGWSPCTWVTGGGRCILWPGSCSTSCPMYIRGTAAGCSATSSRTTDTDAIAEHRPCVYVYQWWLWRCHYRHSACDESTPGFGRRWVYVSEYKGIDRAYIFRGSETIKLIYDIV